ncbi:uncharacterized protein [Leptinotarsa decemlineata]|uniref:uncharacterized protein n=1 Tax=Leptinotarsa decemlineata TaxID=7539 RepID=UPI003D3086C1
MEMKHCIDSSELGLFKVIQTGKKKHFRIKTGLAIAGLSTFIVLLFLIIICTKKIGSENPSSETNNNIFQAPSLNDGNAQTSVHPKPFKVEYRGPMPRKFSPTPPTTTSTTKRPTTLIYPQLTNYRNRYYPKNIQEIVRHMTNKPVHQTMEYTRNTGKRDVNNSKEYLNNSVNDDIFHRYKPNDPSEVNLLATGRVRFAPPVWKDFRNLEDEHNRPQLQFIPKISQITNHPYSTIPLNSSSAENVPVLLTNEKRVTNENDMTKVMDHFLNFRETAKKPMTITLNLYPIETSYAAGNNPKSGIPVFSQEESRSDLSKMTINLRVFPEHSNLN